MPDKPLVCALFIVLSQAPAALSRPPNDSSTRMVKDDVAVLKAEVQRLEREVASDKSLAEDLAVARAQLAAAEGNRGEARAAWQKIIAAREERRVRWELLATKGMVCDATDPAIRRGPVAEA